MIGCSAPLHSIIDDPLLSFVINSKATVLIAKVVTVSINDIYLSDLNEAVLLSYNFVGCLRIVNSTFKGAIHTLYQSLVQEIEDTGIKIEVRDSEFFAGEKDLLQTGGIIFDTPEPTIEIFFIIERSSFNGIKKTNGFLLSVHFGHCSLLELLLMNVTFNQSGVRINSRDLNSLEQSVNISIQNSLFISRTGLLISGLIKTTYNNQVTVNVSNSTFSSSGCGLSVTLATAYLENLTFENSMAALRLYRSTAYFKGTNVFSKNYGERQKFAAVLIYKSQAYVEGKLIVIANSERKYSAVIVKASNLFINGRVHFSENRGFYGGALSLYFDSIVTLLPEGSITFIRNHALNSGGAIYVETKRSCLSKVELEVQCFYRFSGKVSQRRLHFCNNTSVQGGDSIFGGSVDDCLNEKNNFLNFDFNNNIEFCNEDNSTSLISSNPKRLCFCSQNLVVCDQLKANISVIPGQSFELSITAVGQRYGTTIAIVVAKFIDPSDESTPKVFIEHLQKRQLVDRFCSSVRYTVHSIAAKYTLYLSIADFAEDIKTNLEYANVNKQPIGEFTTEIPLSINIDLNECPIGYIFQQTTLTCVCLRPLLEAAVQCNIDNTTVRKSGNQWINATKRTLIIHKHCPYTYCRKEQIEFLLSDPSMQCAFHRSGTLCGQCSGNLSQVLGAFNCQECSNIWVLLIIPLTLVCGILLIAFTISLNLTVAVGTINGLILYANIVRANNAIFFSRQAYMVTNVCAVFIAWVNLDLGIQTCFYNGLDAYAKTIFQLAFPIYIFTLVGIVIVSSHYSTRAAKLSGTNAVQVLATLFLLSYSKLIRLVITVLSPSKFNHSGFPERYQHY